MVRVLGVDIRERASGDTTRDAVLAVLHSAGDAPCNWRHGRPHQRDDLPVASGASERASAEDDQRRGMIGAPRPAASLDPKP